MFTRFCYSASFSMAAHMAQSSLKREESFMERPLQELPIRMMGLFFPAQAVQLGVISLGVSRQTMCSFYFLFFTSRL